MEKDPQTQSAAPDAPAAESHSMVSKVIKAIALPFAALAGFWFTQTGIRNSAYDNAKAHGAFDDMMRDEPGSFYNKLKQTGREARQAVERGETYDMVAAAQHLHTERTAHVTERLQKIGLGSFAKQWHFTGKHHKQQALMNGLTAAGVAIGALYSVANSKTLGKTLEHHEKEKAEGERGVS